MGAAVQIIRVPGKAGTVTRMGEAEGKTAPTRTRLEGLIRLLAIHHDQCQVGTRPVVALLHMHMMSKLVAKWRLCRVARVTV